MAAAASPKTTFLNPSAFPSPSASRSPFLISKSTLPFSFPSSFRALHITNSLPESTTTTTTTTAKPNPSPNQFTSRFADDEPRKGADILVEALEREGVTDVFAYPGGASMEIHQALTRSNSIRNILPRHEQGGIFAAEGYARSSQQLRTRFTRGDRSRTDRFQSSSSSARRSPSSSRSPIPFLLPLAGPVLLQLRPRIHSRFKLKPNESLLNWIHLEPDPTESIRLGPSPFNLVRVSSNRVRVGTKTTVRASCRNQIHS